MNESIIKEQLTLVRDKVQGLLDGLANVAIVNKAPFGFGTPGQPSGGQIATPPVPETHPLYEESWSHFPRPEFVELYPPDPALGEGEVVIYGWIHPRKAVIKECKPIG